MNGTSRKIITGEVIDVLRLLGLWGERYNTSKLKRFLTRRHISVTCLVVIGAFLITYGTIQLLMPEIESAAARSEYQRLREEFSRITAPQELVHDEPVLGTNTGETREDGSETVIERDLFITLEMVIETHELASFADINDDFIGWMSIAGILEYPVVRGLDNVRYLRTTFTGERNPAGTIFMDYRNRGGFNDTVSIIYGHNMWDGSMFSPVVRYLDPNFKDANPYIEITTRDGCVLTYRVFYARLTDAWDIAYSIAIFEPERVVSEIPNVPPETSRFLLLSTCTKGGSNDERIIVFAGLVS